MVSGQVGPWSWRFKRWAWWRCLRIKATAISSSAADAFSAPNLSLLLRFSTVLLHPLLLPVLRLPFLSLEMPSWQLLSCSWCKSTWCTIRCAPAWYRMLQAALHGFCSTESPLLRTFRASECCPATMKSMLSSSKHAANNRSSSSSFLFRTLSFSFSTSFSFFKSSILPSATTTIPPDSSCPSRQDEEDEDGKEEDEDGNEELEDEEDEDEAGSVDSSNELGWTHAGHSHRNRKDSNSSFLLLSLSWRRSM